MKCQHCIKMSKEYEKAAEEIELLEEEIHELLLADKKNTEIVEKYSKENDTLLLEMTGLNKQKDDLIDEHHNLAAGLIVGIAST